VSNIINVVLDVLKKELTLPRYQHSLGVAETAVALAKRLGGDVFKARLAGLLHDCARDLPASRLLIMAETFGIPITDIEAAEPVLLHAPVGARLADIKFGVDDREIFQAIKCHTTGGPGMSLLDQVIYLADFIEPGRKYPGVEKLRDIAEKDFEAAVVAAFDQTLNYLIAKNGLIHQDTVVGRNELLLARQRRS